MLFYRIKFVSDIYIKQLGHSRSFLLATKAPAADNKSE